MKKVYVQKKVFIFMNIFSVFFLLVGLYGGITSDTNMFYLLFVSLGLSLLSLLFLVNRIYYNEDEIKFTFIYRSIGGYRQNFAKSYYGIKIVSNKKLIYIFTMPF